MQKEYQRKLEELKNQGIIIDRDMVRIEAESTTWIARHDLIALLIGTRDVRPTFESAKKLLGTISYMLSEVED